MVLHAPLKSMGTLTPISLTERFNPTPRTWKMKSFIFYILQKNSPKRIRMAAKWRNYFKLLPMTQLTMVMSIPKEQHCCHPTKPNHIPQNFNTNIFKILFSEMGYAFPTAQRHTEQREHQNKLKSKSIMNLEMCWSCIPKDRVRTVTLHLLSNINHCKAGTCPYKCPSAPCILPADIPAYSQNRQGCQVLKIQRKL